MTKKIKDVDEKVDETVEETVDETVDETTEEETAAADEKAMDKMKSMIESKIESAIKDIHENPAKESPVYRKDVVAVDKSVMETDAFRRSKAPFVKLSKGMEVFVEDIKSLAKTGMLKSNIKALNEGSDTAGGFLVPEEFNAEVIRYATENAVVRPRARVFTMARDILTLPKLDQSSDNFAGVDLHWVTESEEKTESQPAFGKITLNVKKLIGLCPASDEVLADSAINLANYLVALFGEAIGYEEDYRFIRGTGVGQPLGIIETTGINLVSRNTSARILVDDIVDMYTGHPAYADSNAVWLTTKSGLGQLLQMGYETTGGITLFMNNMRDSVSPTLFGKPIILTEKLPALGLKGDIILADLKQYYIGDRGGLQVDSSIHDRFRYDETVFRFVRRVDGQPAIPAAFTVLIR